MSYAKPSIEAFDTAKAEAVSGQSTAIVVPCYNEAERLDGQKFIEALLDMPELKFVFVNDGSADATLVVLQKLQATMPSRISVVNLAQNSGKAEAVRIGLKYACRTGAQKVGYWDADLATPLHAIADFDRVMDRYADLSVVYGARRQMLGHRINRTLSRRVVSRICSTLARLAVGLPIGDTQCGAKMLRNTEALNAALAKPFKAGWLFDVELFTRIAAKTENAEQRFFEMPLAEWYEVPGSKVSGRAILRSGVQMLRLIWQRWTEATVATPSAAS